MQSVASLELDYQNREWIDEHLDVLLDTYRGMYIAVSNEKVIASATSVGRLKQAVKTTSLFSVPDYYTVSYLPEKPTAMLL